MTARTIERLIGLALAEDGLALAEEDRATHAALGDLTSTATVAADATAHGDLVARRAGVVAGGDLAGAVFTAVDPAVTLTGVAGDGSPVAAGQALGAVTGPARAVLAAERTALNLLGHLCGVATLTARYVDAVAGTGCAIRDTRKTLPGLRAAEKRAVAAAGGVNHRAGLADGFLVKDNHVVAAGGVGAATRLALEAAGDRHRVQVEVDDLAGLDEAVAAGAPAVLCDNFALDDLVVAVSRCRERAEPVFVEASGGVDLDTVAAVAATGVDAIAVGALTHSAAALDIGLDLHEVR